MKTNGLSQILDSEKAEICGPIHESDNQQYVSIHIKLGTKSEFALGKQPLGPMTFPTSI
jgi:hypothetical protein